MGCKDEELSLLHHAFSTATAAAEKALKDAAWFRTQATEILETMTGTEPGSEKYKLLDKAFKTAMEGAECSVKVANTFADEAMFIVTQIEKLS